MWSPRRIIYAEFAIFGGLLGIASSVFTLKASDMANMTNTFATVSGVLLGLYFVVKARQEESEAPVTELLLFSILLSLISSVISYGQAQYSSILFTVSALMFEASTVYFVIRTQLLGPLGKR